MLLKVSAKAVQFADFGKEIEVEILGWTLPSPSEWNVPCEPYKVELTNGSGSSVQMQAYSGVFTIQALFNSCISAINTAKNPENDWPPKLNYRKSNFCDGVSSKEFGSAVWKCPSEAIGEKWVQAKVNVADKATEKLSNHLMLS